jgi:hypothetical protein
MLLWSGTRRFRCDSCAVLSRVPLSDEKIRLGTVSQQHRTILRERHVGAA